MKSDSLTKKYLPYALIGLLAIIGFLLFKINSLEDPTSATAPQTINLWLIFITGLSVGGLTCLAVQGGLLASVIASGEDQELDKPKNKFHSMWATGAFLGTKLIAYTLLGFLLGAFGGALNISPQVQIWMQIAAGLYMFAVAMNLLNVHPIFRYVIIQPPRFLTRMVRNQSKSSQLFAPGFLGALTIFIPCGTTLAMEALAISSASALMGASIMFVFVLGTIPLFFGVGWITSILGDTFKKGFFRLAALALIYLSFTSITGALNAGGVSINFQGNATKTQALQQYQGPVQEITIDISSQGYRPSNLTVKQGVPIRLNLRSENAFSCASAFRIPSLGVVANLQPNETKTIEIPAQATGQLAFTCSMGMYNGVIKVI